MNKKFVASIFLSLVFTSGNQCSFAAEPKLSGGFIQFIDANLPKPDHVALPFAWEDVVTDMSDLKMSKIVIQRMKVKNNDAAGSQSEFYFIDPVTKIPYNNDPLKIILQKAQEKNMDVFVGLYSDESINGNNARLMNAANQPEFHRLLDAQADNDLAVAKTLWESYSANSAFKGWYLPIEPWNFQWQEWKNAEFNLYLKKVSTGLALLKKDQGSGMRRLPVMWAPHFKVAYLNAPDTGSLYKRLLDGTKIDIIAVQDGFGAEPRRSNTEINDYFSAFKSACETLVSDVNVSGKAELWSDAELYSASGVPVTIEKLKKQLCAVKNLVTTIICWDFFHYMTDKVPNTPANWAFPMVSSPLNSRKVLHDDYKQSFVNETFTCPDR